MSPGKNEVTDPRRRMAMSPGKNEVTDPRRRMGAKVTARDTQRFTRASLYPCSAPIPSHPSSKGRGISTKALSWEGIPTLRPASPAPAGGCGVSGKSWYLPERCGSDSPAREGRLRRASLVAIAAI